MASNRAKVIGVDAGMASTRGKSNDVKHTLGSSNNNINYPGFFELRSFEFPDFSNHLLGPFD